MMTKAEHANKQIKLEIERRFKYAAKLIYYHIGLIHGARSILKEQGEKTSKPYAYLRESGNCLYYELRWGLYHRETFLLIGRKNSYEPLTPEYRYDYSPELDIMMEYKQNPSFIPIDYRDVVIELIPEIPIVAYSRYCLSEYHNREINYQRFYWDQQGQFMKSGSISGHTPSICDDCIREKEKQHKQREEYKKTHSYQRTLMTKTLRKKILKRDEYRCQNPNCNHIDNTGESLHIDHIIPLSRGGKTKASNLQVLCQSCNNSKHNKTMDEWLSNQ